MEKIIVDFNKMGTLEEFHDFIIEKLELGDSYERNLCSLRKVASETNLSFEVIKGGNILEEMQEIISDILCN